jgi:hypothetical protein
MLELSRLMTCERLRIAKVRVANRGEDEAKLIAIIRAVRKRPRGAPRISSAVIKALV